ncbi:MAG: hypothetical protein GF421_08920 [Candidatus Aminicenantes bacterium]|nr:hypothetical protein [Candidatus Aminicenantes bacterium]
MNVSHTTTNRAENGKQNLRISNLIAIAGALKILPQELFIRESLIAETKLKESLRPYRKKTFDYEAIKLFEDTITLGPGHEINELPPKDYIPLSKKFPPKGFKSDPDRIVAFETEGISMKPLSMTDP